MLKVIISIMILISYSFPYDVAGAEAPFGYKWGQKVDTRKCTEHEEVSKGTTVCKTSDVPKPFSKLDFVYLVLRNGALVKVTAYLKDITNDPFGTAGLEAYGSLKGVLSKKYGEPSSEAEFIGRELYQESSEFYQCLKYDGCGMFFSVWGVSEGSQVALQLEGSRRGTGFIKLIYESTMFKEAVAEMEQRSEQEAGENL